MTNARLIDKAEIQKYLKASGIPHANILTGFFLENFVSKYVFLPLVGPIAHVGHGRPSMMSLTPTATGGYELKTPVSPAAINTVCWIGKEMGSAVAALMRGYAEGKVRYYAGS